MAVRLEEENEQLLKEKVISVYMRWLWNSCFPVLCKYIGLVDNSL